MVIRRIGIDFGTSTSVMMYKDYDENGEPLVEQRPFVIGDDNSNTIPSVVLETTGGEKIFGKRAEGSEETGDLYVNFKMDLASEGEDYQQALALTEDFFRYLRQLFEAQLDDGDAYDQEITCISYPAKWKKNVVEDMMEVARRAGFKNVQGMDEPTAAVNSLIYQNQKRLQENSLLKAGKDNHVLMIDMGAGTMDLVFCTYRPGADDPLKILLSWPESRFEDCFGGREIDEKLTEQSLIYLQQNGKDYSDRKETLRSRNKRWKEYELSRKLNTDGRFSGAPSFIQNILERDKDSMEEYPVLDRLGFEEACGELLQIFPKMVCDCSEALEEKWGINLFEETELIILTGGNSAWYFVHDYLKGQRPSRYGYLQFKKIMENPERIFLMNRPQETVAYGLALSDVMVRQVSKKLSVESAKAARPVPGGTDSSQPAAGSSAGAVKPTMDATKEQEIMKKIAAQSKVEAQKEAKRDKNELYYKKVKDLQIVVELVNEAAVALEDKTRVIAQSPTANALYIAGKGAGALGAGLSLAAMYSLGIPTIVTFFSTSLLYMGAAALAGTFALAAAPVVVLGAGGALVAKKAKKNHLIKEKRRILLEVKEKIRLLMQAMKQEKDSPEERRQLLRTLKDNLMKAQKELTSDLAKEGV